MSDDPGPQVDVFVYFKSLDTHESLIAGLLLRRVARLAAQWQVEGRSFARAYDDANEVTWMEVYRGVPESQLDAFRASMDDSVETCGLARLIEGARHCEVFRPLTRESGNDDRANDPDP